MVKIMRFLTSSLLLGISSVAVASEQGMGLVTMNGQIQESACSIHTDDIWQEIPFGVISYNDLDQEGKAIIKPFAVRLVNCSLERSDGGLWQSVNITFSGETEVFRRDIFKVYGDAQGLGLRIHSQVGDVAQDEFRCLPSCYKMIIMNCVIYYRWCAAENRCRKVTGTELFALW